MKKMKYILLGLLLAIPLSINLSSCDNISSSESSNTTSTNTTTETTTDTTSSTSSISVHNCSDYELIKIDMIPANCNNEGVIEHYKCPKCNKLYKDAEGKVLITDESDLIIPITHTITAEYDYETNEYTLKCSQCDYIETIIAGESEEYPLLIKDKATFENVKNIFDNENENKKENVYIALSDNIEVDYKFSNCVVFTLPKGSIFDLRNYSFKVLYNMGLIIQGENITIKNGTFQAGENQNYSLFLGDSNANNNVLLENINSIGGLNFFNTKATLRNCNVDATNTTYRAIWGDENTQITIESGTYIGGNSDCIHSCVKYDDTGSVQVNEVKILGGTFYGKIIATNLTSIYGGTFSDSREVDGTTTKYESNIYVSRYSYEENTWEGKLFVSNEFYDTIKDRIKVGDSSYEIEETSDKNGHTFVTIPSLNQ